jgi:subtilisin family serine protease
LRRFADDRRSRGIRGFLASGEAKQGIFIGDGADVPFAGTEHWCPGEAADPIFSNRDAAERLLDVPYLRDTKKRTGKNVNVAVVDQGLNKQLLGGNYGGGWSVGGTLPGTTSPADPCSVRPTHGMMIAHNILQVAPDATLFDLPLVPWKILDIPVFLALADAAFRTMLQAIANYKAGSVYNGPWIIVNPWGVFDTKTDLAPPNDYVNNATHSFNVQITNAVASGIDIVFAAGNCGQFCPDHRCGCADIGPGHSILGANSLASVLTVGAVRADTTWLGYSSQGPGQSHLAHDKPDLCATSQFHESGDAFTVNTGTSAATALATGVVAGLRSKPSAAGLTPAKLKSILIQTARKVDGPGWNGRRGHGVLNARAAHDAIP